MMKEQISPIRPEINTRASERNLQLEPNCFHVIESPSPPVASWLYLKSGMTNIRNLIPLVPSFSLTFCCPTLIVAQKETALMITCAQETQHSIYPRK